MTQIHPNGIGGTTGDSLALAKPLYTSKTIYFVDSQTGDASYSGKDRKSPFATIAQAISDISTNDEHIVVCLDGHTEEVSTTITLGQRVTIVGEGSSSGVPTVKLTVGHASNDVITVGAVDCEIRNIYFLPPGNAASPAASTASMIDAATFDGLRIIGCKFDVDEHSNAAAVLIGTGADRVRIVNSTFTSVETSTTAGTRPFPAVDVAGAILALELDGCVFDGGVEGFNDGSGNNWAFDGSAAAITGLRAVNMSLLRGGDFKIHTSTTGYVSVPTSTGSSTVVWE